MHLLEVRHLLLISAVADEGNLTRAGERLNLTQSALSHQLLDIEERLGTALFQRLNRRMKLTDAGERLLTSARRVLDDLSHAEEELRLFATNQRGILRMSTECYTTYHWLPHLMRQFEKTYPNIEIRVDAMATGRTIPALLDGQIDLALILDEDVDGSITTRPLFDDEMLVVVDPGHRLARRQYVKATDFEDETLITYGGLDEMRVYQRLLRPAGVEPKKTMVVGLTEALIEMVREGIGIAVLSSWAVMPYINAGLLVGVPLTRRGFSRKWQIAHAASRALPEYFTAFIDLLAAHGERLSVKNARAIRTAAAEREALETMLELAGDHDPMPVLKSTAAALRDMLQNVPDVAARRPERDGKWSILQVVRHLADAELIDGWRYRQTVAQPNSVLPAFDQDAWLERLWDPNQTLADAVQRFTTMREWNMGLLEALTAEEWDLSATHAERGRESLRLMARIAAGHDLMHLRQIKRIRTAMAA